VPLPCKENRNPELRLKQKERMCVCVCVHASLAPIYHNASSQRKILEQDVYVESTLQKSRNSKPFTRHLCVDAPRKIAISKRYVTITEVCVCVHFSPPPRTTIPHPERQQASLFLLVLL
jgi:hypothetical protein